MDLDICQHFNIVSSSVTILFNSFESNGNVYFVVPLERINRLLFARQ